ncbi:hypothetical protein DENIS_1366 [Desulfonema ishimotonii]|uniref:YEATS domain-containing protein n=1 Tax=Desulfonema ishimotonii TaxID=45657 RepID=A0A401FTY8_9BACT|nr:P-loop NTPase fold protein [Desulfonema ishimotonii]GBC60414.1 hypothetical protein DENIS_1366 [Desulfonema ishimotonii]
MMKKLKLLTDEALSFEKDSRQDELGFDRYSEALAGAVMGTEGPFTIGILGEWGTGKTSLMKMIREKIDQEENILTVWFNAWRFAQEEHPIVPLVATIFQALGEKEDFIENKEDKNRLTKALGSLVYGLSIKSSLKVPGFGGIQAELKPRDVIERMETADNPKAKAAISHATERSIYYGAFESLSDIRLDGDKKIVVLIDDMDRCLPDHVVKLLETIKLVLSQPHFLFILGISRTVIEGYLEHRYRQEYGLTEFRGSQYLDKIIQLPFFLPPHSERIKEFAKKLLKYFEEEKDYENIQVIADIIGPACYYNPREVVRFINKLIISSEINQRKTPIGYFAITLSLQQLWKKFFWDLLRFPELCPQIAQWKEAELSEYVRSFSERENLSSEEKAKGEILQTLNQDNNLKKLLFSRQGQSWLENTEARQTTIHHLSTQAEQFQRYEERISLIHSSWRYLKADERFKDKERKMYAFHAVIDAPREILNQINSVTYYLHPSYPNPVRIVTDMSTRFKLKELAWASSTLKAEVRLRNQEEPVRLSRHITLNETGPRI